MPGSRASSSTAERARLSEHLDALLAQDAVASPLPLDKELVKHTRLVLGADPLPQRIYNRMRHYGLGSAFPEFTIEAAAGPRPRSPSRVPAAHR